MVVLSYRDQKLHRSCTRIVVGTLYIVCIYKADMCVKHDQRALRASELSNECRMHFLQDKLTNYLVGLHEPYVGTRQSFDVAI